MNMKIVKLFLVLTVICVISSCSMKNQDNQTTTSDTVYDEHKTVVQKSNIEIKIGDYVQLGEYYNEPILWRCVSIDEKGPLLWSDRVICVKAFDAGSKGGSGNIKLDRRDMGSNRWKDSTIRAWLNSNETGGNIKWPRDNPPMSDCVQVTRQFDYSYDKEDGFLTHFSAKEKQLIKEITQKSAIGYPEYSTGKYTYGSEGIKSSKYLSEGIKNFETAYAEDTIDKVFLLDISQAYQVYQNRDILGDNYWIGIQTEICHSTIGYIYRPLETECWLRTPDDESEEGVCVRMFDTEGKMERCGAYGAVGIRPAFYISENTKLFTSGDGSKLNPYSVF